VPTQLETHQHLSIPNLNKTVASISPAQVHPLHWKKKRWRRRERGFETDRDEIGEGEKRAARWV
jgi:hypothetical protein